MQLAALPISGMKQQEMGSSGASVSSVSLTVSKEMFLAALEKWENINPER